MFFCLLVISLFLRCCSVLYSVRSTTKYYITNDLALMWPARCLLILYKSKVMVFFYYWLKVKLGEKKNHKRGYFCTFTLQFHSIIEGFQDIFHPDSEFVSFFFLPTSDLSKRDPLQEFQQITGACCLLLPLFFFFF